MAVTGSQLHWRGATGNVELSGAQYLAVHRVTTDDANDQAQTVLLWAQSNIAALGSAYSYANDTSATTAELTRIRAERDLGSAFVWDVIFEYGQPDDGDGLDTDGNEVSNPLSFRPDISVQTVQYQRPFHKAVYEGGFKGFMSEIREVGSEYVPTNSALVPLEPPLQGDDSRLAVSVRKNLSTYDASEDDEEANSVNGDDLQIDKFGLKITIPKRTAKIRETRVSFRRQNGQDFWEVTKTFDRDRRGWVEEIPDKGLVRRALPGDPASDVESFSQPLPEGDPGVRRIKDADGEPVPEPVFLDGDGEPLGKDTDPVIISWRKYTEISFKAISFFSDIFD